MPSLLHEGLLQPVRDRPELVATLLTQLLDVRVPPFTSARLVEAALPDLVPVEYHADVIVLLVDGEPVFGAILEAQLQPDPRKLFTWPFYALAARARHECPFVVVVERRPIPRPRGGPGSRSTSATACTIACT